MEHGKTPKIRFNGFNDNWEVRKFGNAFDGLSNNTFSRAEMNYENGSVKNIHYGDVLIKFGEYIDVSKENLPFITGNINIANFKNSFLQNGDIVIADTAEDNTVGKCTEIQGVDKLQVLAGLHTIANRPKTKYGAKFLGYYLNSHAYHHQLIPLMQGIKVTSISKSALQETNITIPQSHAEQQRIGEYFSRLDDLIGLYKRKSEKSLNLKKAMLEKMFPQNGKPTPQIRFAGFSDNWEVKKLGECFFERKESMPSGELISVTIADGVKKFAELGRHDNSNDDKSKYKKVCIGDIAYNSMRMWQGASGYSPYEGIVSPAYTVLVPNNEIVNSKCMSYFFKRQDMLGVFQTNSQGIASDNWNLKYPVLSKIEIKISKSIAEQERIGQYFSRLDDLIGLYKRKLEKSLNLKKAMLEKMFP